MGLYRFKPMPSGRMGIFWTVSSIGEAAVVEFGCMGHNLYSGSLLRQSGIYEGYGAPLYTTYIDETDIAMGQTYRLEATLRQVVDTDHPKVVFLQPSAVPEVIGMDMYAIANLLADEFPETKLVPLGHGSFAITQHKGVEEALLAVVKALAEDVPRTLSPTYNVLGTCPDLFNFGADLAEIERMMRGAFGMEAVCRLSSACSISDIERIGSAHVNLVIRREGIPAAEYLQKRFGTPYLYARPYGIRGTSAWLRRVGETLDTAPSEDFLDAEEKLALMQIDQPYRTLESNAWSYPEEAVLTIGGHYDVVRGIRDFAVRLIRDFNVKASSPTQKMRELSGGNAQKLIVAREMSLDTPVLICCEPTRGIDIGAMEAIHNRMLQRRDDGAAILLVSSELTEIMSLSDRIYVIFEGRIVGEFERGSMDDRHLGLLMVGGSIGHEQ